MGAIAESMVAYAQPLVDASDGSADGFQRAFTLAQVCWNLALLPEQERDEVLAEMKGTLKMDDADFVAFRDSVVLPMIRRHREMFPHMPGLGSMVPASGRRAVQDRAPTPSIPEKYPGTARNAPCPCNSGKKYKLCCGPGRFTKTGPR